MVMVTGESRLFSKMIASLYMTKVPAIDCTVCCQSLKDFA